jgi:Ca-activated chloride channel family protein
VALVSWTTPDYPIDTTTPRKLKILIDCSGSMEGMRIAQARRIVTATLTHLHNTDRVSLTRFGREVQPLTQGLQPALPDLLDNLRRATQNSEADMGGTELPYALRFVTGQPSRSLGEQNLPSREEDADGDILLITDADTWERASVLSAVENRGNRVFVFAVGAAPAEALVRELAYRTRGAYEFVTPEESIEAAAERMMKRIRAPLYRLQSLEWPQAPLWSGPLPQAIFPGDTVHLTAGFAAQPLGTMQLHVQDMNAQPLPVPAVPLATSVREDDTLARLAAGWRLAELNEEQAAALAERHQLVSRFTSLVLVKQRAAGEQAKDLPALRPIAQMAPADHGAFTTKGTLRSPPSVEAAGIPRMLGGSATRETFGSERHMRGPMGGSKALDRRGDDSRQTAQRLSPSWTKNLPNQTPDELFIRVLRTAYSISKLPSSFQDLAQLGVPDAVLSALSTSTTEPVSEEQLVHLWLAMSLLKLHPGVENDPAPVLQGLMRLLSERDTRALRAALRPIVEKCSAAAWGL